MEFLPTSGSLREFNESFINVFSFDSGIATGEHSARGEVAVLGESARLAF